MDPLDVMIHQEQIIPFYQPIINAEKQLIIGYEVLAKIKTDEGIKSLGWFFRDRSIPEEYRIEIQDVILKKALATLQGSDQQVLLFVNYDAKLLLADNGENFLKRIESLEQPKSVHPNIVLQLEENLVMENPDEMKHLVAYLQSAGFKIAVHELNTKSSNLDHLALLSPDIVKVDVSFLNEDSLPHVFREVHHSISMLSRKIGATLLFEGISGFHHLNYAWRNGGRYYEGYYLSEEHSEFVPIDKCKVKLQKEFQHFITFERKKVEAQIRLLNDMNQKMKLAAKELMKEKDLDQLTLKIGNDCQEFAFRVYICDQDGFQKTANAERDEYGLWQLHPEGRNKNWSWRPYFLENIVRMNVEKKGLLSDLYTDIERDERIRTYSFPLTESLYLFVDIPYEYLFEKDGLL
ncbi:EAL domain-containing protein [Alkalihalobacillus pseudalcaliphilus]|uniref:EAL domain-containing protein n=1 Tax=Alkalihalobacillus pseudalcaliphilus TaxID=79884 RepID=UPI00064DB6D0|nr:EAL domain-containing protein [Alkalihalobacillus pseudalcaliphilus]KMK76566.1 diguanylate phosphodiesterase [Alkalihalobacillus pseudalcaliphilus]